MAVFSPPTQDRVSPVYANRDDPIYPVGPLAHRLFRHFKQRAVGRTVLKNGETYTTLDYPTQDQLDAADVVYLGGHVYEVDSEEATALTNAGYGDYVD